LNLNVAGHSCWEGYLGRVSAHGALLYGHRGASAELPENTLPAFARALERGATAIETDAHLTSDGHLVLAHDEDGRRMAGVARAIRDASLAEVKSWDVGRGFVDQAGARPFAGRGFRMPTLDEALAEIGDVPFNVDLKARSPALAGLVLDVLRRHRAEERVRLASFDFRTTRAIRRRGFSGGRGLGIAEVGLLVALPARALRRLFRPGDAAQLPLRAFGVDFATRAYVEKCHEIGLRIDYWVINDAPLAARLLELGADGIMTDDPRLMAPVFAPRA
jgi:glycerophosphoryl diester phosphodiesterase